MARDPHAIIDFKWAETPDEANDVVRPSVTLILTGWDDSYIVDDGNDPLQETFNYLVRAFSAGLKELNRRGIYEWDDTTDFEDPCVCLLESKIYFSLPGEDPGVNVDPRITNTVWTKGWAPGDSIPISELPTITVAKGGTGRTDGANLVPSGGASQYALVKNSAADFDTEWAEIDTSMPTIPDSQDPISVIIRTTNYTVQPADNNAIVLVSTTANNRTVTLPNLAAADAGFLIRIKKTNSSNTLTINPATGDDIDGVSAVSLADINESAVFAWDGSNWVILSSHRPSPLPLKYGGLGATTAAGGRTTLGLGSAATRDTGTAQNDLALLQSGGSFAQARIPDLNASKTTAGVFASARLPNATTAQRGISELATPAEAEAGTDTQRPVTAAGVRSFIENLETLTIITTSLAPFTYTNPSAGVDGAAYADGEVWVFDSSGGSNFTVTRIDTVSRTSLGTFTYTNPNSTITGIVYADGEVWVFSSASGNNFTVTRISIASRTSLGTFTYTGPNDTLTGIAYADDEVWVFGSVSGNNFTVTRLSIASRTSLGTFTYNNPTVAFDGIAYADGEVWVFDSIMANNYNVARISVASRMSLGTFIYTNPTSGFDEVVYADGEIWVFDPGSSGDFSVTPILKSLVLVAP